MFNNKVSFIAITVGAALTAAPARAHPGHLGELAGHGHWIALAAGVIAALLAATLARLPKDKTANEASVEEEAASDDKTERAAK
jgi:hypothetical protein